MGLVLTPGTYKLKWEVRQQAADPLWKIHSHNFAFPRDLSIPKEGIKEAASKHAAVSSSLGGMYSVVLDESKGTGKGYDTLYVGLATVGQDINLRTMVRVPLRLQHGVLVADGYAANVPMGSSRRQRFIDASIRLKRSKDGSLSSWTRIYVRGAWYGSVKTNQGIMNVRLLENEAFGRWGSFVVGKPGAIVPTVRGPSGSATVDAGSLITFDNRLYNIKISSSGDTLTIKPYAGPTGTIAVNSVNGFGKPVYSYRLWMGSPLASRDGLEFYLRGKQTLRVPCGTYDSASADLSVNSHNWPSLTSRLPQFRVDKDKVTKLNFGGPVRFRMSAEKSDEGKCLIACEWLLPNPQRCGSVFGNADMLLVLKDAKGKTAYSKRITDHAGMDSDYFSLPGGLKPGNYVAVLTVDLHPYDRKRVFGARLQVE
jgi:hypothetical protein